MSKDGSRLLKLFPLKVYGKLKLRLSYQDSLSVSSLFTHFIGLSLNKSTPL
nr:MAG TPA: hypothetical protein [Caudoviricetes sp.]